MYITKNVEMPEDLDFEKFPLQSIHFMAQIINSKNLKTTLRAFFIIF